MHLPRLVPLAALLGAFLFPSPLPGQEAAAKLLDARQKYERAKTELMQKADSRLRDLDEPAAVRSEALKALRERGQIDRLSALKDLASAVEEQRSHLLGAFEACADSMLRNEDPALDQVLVEQKLWQQILDSLPWRPVDVATLEKSGDAGFTWKPPEGASCGYRLQVRGSVDQGQVGSVDFVLPVALPEKRIVHVPVVDGRFAATLTVGPNGDVALDLGVPRDGKAFARREASVAELQITADKATVQVLELQWKPFLLRTDQAKVAVVKEKQDAEVQKPPEGGKGDAADPKQKAGTPKAAAPAPAPGKPAAPVPAAAAAKKEGVWEVGTKVAGWRTSNAKPQTEAKDCSLHGQVTSVANDQIVIEVDERWRGPRGWVTPHREWVWKRVGFDQMTGETLLELVEARKDGRVVTRNPRGTARLKGNTMRGTYRVDFTNGIVHPDSEKEHDWILELQPANGGR